MHSRLAVSVSRICSYGKYQSINIIQSPVLRGLHSEVAKDTIFISYVSCCQSFFLFLFVPFYFQARHRAPPNDATADHVDRMIEKYKAWS